MRSPFVFHCPITGRDVQGVMDDDLVCPETISVPVYCPICDRPHLIDPRAGIGPPRAKPK